MGLSPLLTAVSPLSVLHCTPHANVNQGHTLYPVTYQAVNSCFSLISSAYLCVCVCVCVCMQRQQVCSFVWKKHQTVLDPQCAFCVCVDLCGWVCQRMWVFYILQTFQAALLAFKNKKIKKKKVPNREPCLFACHLWVGCTLLGTPAFLLASHWIPAGGHWGATTHRASVTNEGESVPHHIEK